MLADYVECWRLRSSAVTEEKWETWVSEEVSSSIAGTFYLTGPHRYDMVYSCVGTVQTILRLTCNLWDYPIKAQVYLIWLQHQSDAVLSLDGSKSKN